MDQMPGIAGVGSTRTATPRNIFVREDAKMFVGKPLLLNGAKSRDFGNTDHPHVIRAGMPIVKEASGGLYVPWILGTVTAIYDASASGTAVSVGVAGAKSIQEYFGASTGTAYFSGAASAGGAVNDSAAGYESKLITAIDTTTGVITLTSDLADDLIVGSTIHPREDTTPEAIIADQWGIKVTDRDEVEMATAPVALAAVGGMLKTSNIIGWPPASATLFTAWFRAQLRAKMPALMFDDIY